MSYRSLPPIFEQVGQDTLKFKSPNGLKTMALQCWVVIGSIEALVYAFGVLKSGRIWSLSDAKDATIFDIAFMYYIMAIPVFFFFLWLFAKPMYCHLDRATQTIRYEWGRRKVTLPWHQVRYRTMNFPTGVGKVALEFFILAVPPFPPHVYPKNPRRLRKLMEQGPPLFSFGSFSVQDEDEARRFEKFFDTFMATDHPAEALYWNIVVAHGDGEIPRVTGNQFADLGEL